jgi:cytochrome c
MSKHWAYLALLIAIGSPSARAGDQPNGETLFARRCGGCHSLDTDKEGPRLRDVYGRRAGQVHGFMYSEALKKAGTTWDETTLDTWLREPGDLVPGTEMDFRVPGAEERKTIIAYLKHLGEK